MRKALRIAGYVALSVAALVVVAIGALLVMRAYRQHVNADAIAIRSPAGIDEARFVTIGGIDQWIQIRGQDRGNPVLLCLHGGPGGTWLPLTALFVPWEKEFTVVQWDQRGAGRTLESTGAAVAETMSIERMTQDGIEVAEYLRTQLHKDKIVLLGHSWGSILGVRMARARPDLFHAYVGTGQVSSMPRSQQASYAHLLESARAANDARAVKRLQGIGPPPFSSLEQVATYFDVLGSYDSDRAALSFMGPMMLSAPGFTLRDMHNRYRGFAQVPPWSLYREMLATDLPAMGLKFEVPVFFFQGAQDDVTPAPLAREYFDGIVAPRKEMVLLEGMGHYAVWIAPDRFLRELVARVKAS